MKKLVLFSLAAFLLAAVFCAAFIAPMTASAEEVRYEVFDLTSKDAVPEDSSKWYSDGIIIAITNGGGAEKTVASGDYPMRYLFILIFDNSGTCVEIGNNLLSADDEKAAGFPQHDIKIPAGGFAILFYYNANEGPSNLALYEYYNDLGGAVLTNETGKVTSGKTYTAAIENNTVTVYFGAEATTPDASSAAPADGSSEASASTDPETSSEDPADASSEASSAVSSEETSAAASSNTPAESSGTSTPAASSSSEVSSASNASDAQTEDGGSKLPLIIGIVVAVVAVIAVAAVVVMKKKKS